MKEFVIIYEREQIPTVLEYVRSKEEISIVALDFWVERELTKQGVSVIPLTEYLPNWKDFDTLHIATEQMARQWHRLPEMSFFAHKGLALGESFELMASIFFGAIQGHLIFFDALIKAHPTMECLVVPHSVGDIPEGAGPFAPYQVTMVARVGEFVASHRGISFKNLGSAPRGELVLQYAYTFCPSSSRACICE
jgi:hypothetical protein